ncbi:6,7-dimethyl-8-ribityllumazine synthase [Candidatus Peribacteria bacterium RIFCSPHIGHO2_02_FULL_52_16]|nr:MAG: 6,7-dimethyl-8-ribityllumazine synthase [Candidatus Peribacteria bacterium RIFCSPHIGHO2_01_FULL_51_35]OGJ60876.1 MAG: 6,7-dimethyl-8-ribityllumazine synthase [Candidatus Peribacteria bacterium RIFCSPHIGHO2_02_FULL_52_16]
MQTNHLQKLPAKIDPSWRIGIVHAEWHAEEIKGLVEGARSTLLAAGISASNILVHPASGSFEIPLIGKTLATEKKVDALIGFGIIVEGETHHAELLAKEVARGIMDVQLNHGIPFAFEVLYVKNIEQARERARVKIGKGAEAAYAALHSLAELHRIRS